MDYAQAAETCARLMALVEPIAQLNAVITAAQAAESAAVEAEARRVVAEQGITAAEDAIAQRQALALRAVEVRDAESDQRRRQADADVLAAQEHARDLLAKAQVEGETILATARQRRAELEEGNAALAGQIVALEAELEAKQKRLAELEALAAKTREIAIQQTAAAVAG